MIEQRLVIDVGCAKHGGDESIPDLVREFTPEWLIGLDPAVGEAKEYWIDDTYVVEEPFVGWTHDGYETFTVASLGGHVGGERGSQFKSYDMARLVREAHELNQEIILKLDIESGEYDLVPYLVAQHVDNLLTLLLVEWHCACGYGIWNGVHPDVGCDRDFDAWLERRDAIIATVRCPIREWTK